MPFKVYIYIYIYIYIYLYNNVELFIFYLIIKTCLFGIIDVASCAVLLEGKPIPTELRKDEAELRKAIQFDDEAHESKKLK